MNVFIFYALSVGISFLSEKIIEIDIIKDLANNGYIYSDKPIEKTDDDYYIDMVLISHFIPMFNIFLGLDDLVTYYKSKDVSIKELQVDDIVDKMTDDEIKLYQENKSLKTIKSIQKNRQNIIGKEDNNEEKEETIEEVDTNNLENGKDGTRDKIDELYKMREFFTKSEKKDIKKSFVKRG